MRELQEAWLEYGYQTQAEGDAAPFLTYAPPEFMSYQKRVLYVGKATAGDFQLDRFRGIAHQPIAARIEERTSLAREVFEQMSRRSNPASFWGFAADLSRAADPDCKDLGNLAWTNVCKVGKVTGNPGPSDADRQAALATETLEREIVDLKPSIVIAVSAHCGEPILRAAVRGENVNDWVKSEDEGSGIADVWWLTKSNGRPPVLWMRHPERSKPALREFALRKVQELVGGS